MKEQQMSDAFITSAFLAFSGGLQDAYTFNTRDRVFANAQTGNLVLMTQNLMEGNLSHSLNYFLPIYALLRYYCNICNRCWTWWSYLQTVRLSNHLDFLYSFIDSISFNA